MKKYTSILSGAALYLGAALSVGAFSGTANAQSSDAAFLECMMNCQQWQDPATRIQCENWCYAVHNPQ